MARAWRRLLSRNSFPKPNQLASAEVYDPKTGKFSSAGSMKTAREYATATLLPGGRILVAGGNNNSSSGIDLATAELFDPTTDLFTSTGSMATARSTHAATSLPDGRVLITGGDGVQGGHAVTLATSELYDPGSGAFGPTGSMSTGRSYHSAVPLADGRVLVAGGSGSKPLFLATAELYDPHTGAFSPTGSMMTPRAGRPAVALLSDGRVLVAGGLGSDDYSLISAEVYQP
jgi:hypothetical protein